MWRRYCVQINMFWWTMLVLLFSPLSGTCEETVLYVGQNQTYTTLQEAVRSLTENQSAEIVIEGVICEKGQLEIRNCKLRLIAEKKHNGISTDCSRSGKTPRSYSVVTKASYPSPAISSPATVKFRSVKGLRSLQKGLHCLSCMVRW